MALGLRMQTVITYVAIVHINSSGYLTCRGPIGERQILTSIGKLIQ